MAFRELTMIDVKEVLCRWSAGQSDRKIGREAGVDCKTAARYTVAATRLGLARGGEVTDEEVHRVGLPARPLVAPSDEWNEVAQHRERIERPLPGDGDARPLRLPKIHTLLTRDHGPCASYDTLWRPVIHRAGRQPGGERRPRQRALGLLAESAPRSFVHWEMGMVPRAR
jgi:hypothetical protein